MYTYDVFMSCGVLHLLGKCEFQEKKEERRTMEIVGCKRGGSTPIRIREGISIYIFSCLFDSSNKNILTVVLSIDNSQLYDLFSVDDT